MNIKTQLLLGLKKIEKAELETANVASIVECNLMLAQKNKVDTKGDLNKWLYDYKLN